MVRGHIDALLSSGYVEGWALDTNAPATSLPIAILEEPNVVLASGLANLFREDLVDAGCGVGWCAFRFRIAAPEKLRRTMLTLVDLKSRAIIGRHDPVAFLYASEPDAGTIAHVIADDPTMIRSIEELRGCDVLFRNLILRGGVDAFVRAAYVYVLSRPADSDGLGHYGRQLRAGAMTPFNLLRALAASDEFRARPRQLVAPSSAAFPLGCD
ncbi:MAG: DUF4214 domain-containing protein [Roseiarcus sp.]|jgi:hypothetical protein